MFEAEMDRRATRESQREYALLERVSVLERELASMRMHVDHLADVDAELASVRTQWASETARMNKLLRCSRG